MNEAHFARDKIQNPYGILPSHHQKWFSINIFPCICGDNLFRPYILNRLTGQNYKAFLEKNMSDFLVDVPLIIHQKPLHA
jgi:hypothetical protein